MNSTILESRFAPTSARTKVVHQNEDFIRQGEWVFVPVPGLVVDARRIRRHEPLRRGSGNAHTVEVIFRTGGEAIYYSEARRRTLTVPQYWTLLQQRRQEVKEDWRIIQREMAFYGRGTVRHPDHCTVTLHDWHRILMNTESAAPALNPVAFLG